MSDSSTQPEALVIDDAEVSEFIKTVELAPISAEQASELAAALNLGYTAFVNRGSIQYLPLPKQQKNDSLYWTLFGQSAADAKVNRFRDPVAWHKEYFRVLNTVGMKGISWKRNSAVVSDGSVDALVSQYLKHFLSPGAEGKLDEIINALGKEANRKALDIFDSTSDGSSANFQISDGTVDKDLNLTLHVGFLDFKAYQYVKRVLFWHFQGNLTINYSSDRLTLSKKSASRYRQQIYRRVVHLIQGNIVGIDLA